MPKNKSRFCDKLRIVAARGKAVPKPLLIPLRIRVLLVRTSKEPDTLIKCRLYVSHPQGSTAARLFVCQRRLTHRHRFNARESFRNRRSLRPLLRELYGRSQAQ